MVIRRADRPKGIDVSQRLIRKAHPIGIVKGVPVYRVTGAQPDEGGEGEGNTPEGGEGGDSGDTGTGSEGTGGETDPSAGSETVSKEEYERLKARMQAADKTAADALKKVKEFEDKDKSETERLTGQVEELTKTNTELAEENKRLKFDNAFALSSKHSWQDPEIVLNIVRSRDDVTIEEDGSVKGLDKALDAIAKEKPFLLKKEEGESGDSGPTGPSGSTTGSGKKNDPSKLDPEYLKKKYPALQT